MASTCSVEFGKTICEPVNVDLVQFTTSIKAGMSLSENSRKKRD